MSAQVPTLAPEVAAIRRGVAFSQLDDVHPVSIQGAGAREAVERLLPCSVAMHSYQARSTLMLDEDGRVVADVIVAREEDRYLLLGEGPSRARFLAHLRGVVGAEAEVADLGPSHGVLSLDGPFAWELLLALEGAGVTAMRYLTLFRPRPDTICLRAGKTGEYGYLYVVPRGELADLTARLEEAGRAFDAMPVGRRALQCAALEAWFYDAHAPGLMGLTPLELGLQWRCRFDKPFVGAEALRTSRTRSPRRLTAFVATAPVPTRAAILLGDEMVGEIRHADWSPTLGMALGAALLDRAIAHSGIAALQAVDASGKRHRLRTVSPPFVNNLSLYVQPGRHVYARRDQVKYPGPAG